MSENEPVTVKFTRPQVAALLYMLDATAGMEISPVLRAELLGARHQLEAWQRAASPADASRLVEGGGES
jgi:hypothetical protein